MRHIGLRRQILEWSSALFLGCITIGPVALFTWLLFFTQTFAVSAITVVDAQTGTQEQVRTLADTMRGKSILFLQTEILSGRLLRDVPQIKNVHIVRKLPGTLKIIIQEKTPVLLLLSKGSYYYVDATGIAYAVASLDSLPGVVLPVVKNSDTNATVTLGALAVEESFVSFIDEVQTKIPDIAKAQVVAMNIPSLAAREVHFFLDRNWNILMDTTRPASAQLDVLQRLLEHTVSAEEQQTLQYIDLRIPNRVYYKIRV